ncbi:MAG: Rieske (2Fe-2S) protein [Ignavibacteriaceae bacterium]
MKSLEQYDQINLQNFEKVCAIKELSEHCGKRFIVNDVDVAVFKVDGKVYALNNVCPHQHTALIYDGFIEGDCVVCPAHGWMFNLETGRMPTNRKGLESYPVVVQDNYVYVEVAKKELNW